MLGLYDEEIDRESAYEILLKREEEAAEAAEEAAKEEARLKEELEKKKARAKKTKTRKSRRQTPTEAAIVTGSRTIARELSKYVLRGIFGSRSR